MQKRFIELTSALVEQIGIDCDIVPDENIVTLPLGDFAVRICLMENLGAAVLQGAVAVVPESDKDALCAELLAMNSLFKGTKGAAFGLEGDIVTLQSFVLLEGITQEAFIAQAVCFLDALAQAIEGFEELLERARSGVATPAQDVPDMMLNMLRI